MQPIRSKISPTVLLNPLNIIATASKDTADNNLVRENIKHIKQTYKYKFITKYGKLKCRLIKVVVYLCIANSKDLESFQACNKNNKINVWKKGKNISLNCFIFCGE